MPSMVSRRGTRVRRPALDRAAKRPAPGYHGIVPSTSTSQRFEGAVRRAHPRSRRRLRAEDRVRTLELLGERAKAELGEARVIPAVARDLVSAPHVLARELRARRALLADDEERRVHRELVEQ